MTIPEEQRPRKLLKNAKLALRNSYLWACIGWAKGIDCEAALVNRCPATTKDPTQTRAQLINGFRHLRDAVAQVLTGVQKALPLGGSRSHRGAKGSAKPQSGLAEAAGEGSTNSDTEFLRVVFDEKPESESADIQATNPQSPMTVTVGDLLTSLSRHNNFPFSDARGCDRGWKDPMRAEKGLYSMHSCPSTVSSSSTAGSSGAGVFSWTSFGPTVRGSS